MNYGPADYILKFVSKQEAELFGIANGFAIEKEGEVITNLATHTYAMNIIGEHYIDGVSDKKYWVIFRDLIGLPFPPDASNFVVWASWMTQEVPDPEDPNKTITVPLPRPTDDPNIPNTWWC